MSSLLKRAILSALLLVVLAVLTWVNLQHVRGSDSSAASPAAAVRLNLDLGPGEAV